MKKVQNGFLVLLFCLLVGNLLAQHGKNNFSNCAAAFLNQNMIVNEYTTEGKCVVDLTAKGELTLRPAELTDAKTVKAGDKIPFKIAIRDGDSKTLLLFSEKTYREIPIQEVLAQCKKGDSIVLLTLEREWALPHSEILVSTAQ
ncbi:MAG: hypothetical protein ACK4TA_06870 [Saprospiraceae bacterium]